MNQQTTMLTVGVGAVLLGATVAVTGTSTATNSSQNIAVPAVSVREVAAEKIDKSAAASKAFAKKYMKSKYGWGAEQYQALLRLWEYESSWSWKEENASSGAYGIPQSLPGNKMKAAGVDWKSNPQTQIRWGLKYIKSTYGSPTSAWAHEESNNWY